jgi:hypothetical protein
VGVRKPALGVATIPPARQPQAPARLAHIPTPGLTVATKRISRCAYTYVWRICVCLPSWAGAARQPGCRTPALRAVAEPIQVQPAPRHPGRHACGPAEDKDAATAQPRSLPRCPALLLRNAVPALAGRSGSGPAARLPRPRPLEHLQGGRSPSRPAGRLPHNRSRRRLPTTLADPAQASAPGLAGDPGPGGHCGISPG